VYFPSVECESGEYQAFNLAKPENLDYIVGGDCIAYRKRDHPFFAACCNAACIGASVGGAFSCARIFKLETSEAYSQDEVAEWNSTHVGE